ncbi:MAG: DNA-methyltransferase [Candidatus Acidiferrales bacterium]
MTTRSSQKDSLLTFALQHLDGVCISRRNAQTAIPALAKNPEAIKAIATASRQLPTAHKIFRGDARRMEQLKDHSLHLVLTSPPYWTLKLYRHSEGQLGHMQDYEEFLDALDAVWGQCYRALVPGGRLIIVVGDVCLSRKTHGRHLVMPLHAAIQERCRKIGFDNLAPIIWYKIANAKYEVDNGTGFLGKPYEPNAVIKNDIEYILMQRKAGGYRKPSLGMRLLSVISEPDHKEWFQQVWTLPGASTRDHPAPFPLLLAERLIRMFSFVGDVVLDPFLGSGTTCLAASRWGRSSIGYEIDETYFRRARLRLEEHMLDLLSGARLEAIEL